MRFIKQSHKYSCGAACACMMLSELGIVRDEPELIGILGSASGRGTPMSNWTRLNAFFPLEVRFHQPGTLEELDELHRTGWQLTLLITAEGPHYVCFLSLDPAGVCYHDPWAGPGRTVAGADFYRSWEVNDIWTEDAIYSSRRWYVGIRKIKT